MGHTDSAGSRGGTIIGYSILEYWNTFFFPNYKHPLTKIIWFCLIDLWSTFINEQVCDSLGNQLENKLFQGKEDPKRKVGGGNYASNHMRRGECELVTHSICLSDLLSSSSAPMIWDPEWERTESENWKKSLLSTLLYIGSTWEYCFKILLI